MPPRLSNGLYLPSRKPPVGTPVDQGHPLAYGLVGAWPLNDGAAGIRNAAQLSDPVAAFSSNVADPFWGIGKYGVTTDAWRGSDATNGRGQRIDTITTSARYQVQSHSMAAWVRTGFMTNPGWGSSYSILSRSRDITAGGFEWAVNYGSLFSPRFSYAYFDGGVQGWYEDGLALSDATDYLLVGTWVPGTVRFYVNGVLSSSVSTTSGTISHSGTDTVLLGFQATSASPQNSSWDGQIHQLLLYNRALSAVEVAQLYAEPFSFYLTQSPARLIFDFGTTSGGTSVFPNAIGTAESVFAPSVLLQVLPGTIATGESVFAPTVSLAGSPQTVTAGAIATGEVLFQPTVLLQVLPGTVTTGETVYAPTVTMPATQTVTPNAIATGEALFAPTVTLQVLPGTVVTGESVYQPTVTVASIPGTINAGTITTGEVVYAPTVSLTVLPGTIATGVTIYAPNVGGAVNPGTIASAESVPAVTVLIQVQPNAIGSGEIVYPPSIQGILGTTMVVWSGTQFRLQTGGSPVDWDTREFVPSFPTTPSVTWIINHFETTP